MNRYRNFGPLDDVPEITGDAAFTRLDMQSDPATLPPGALQVSENFRFDTRQVRNGIALQFQAGTFIGSILFAGVYRPDTSNDRFAFVTEHALVLFNPANQTVTTYYFPSGETVGVGDPVDLVQAGVSSGTLPDLYILRGFDKDALKFDGAVVTTVPAFQRGEFGLFYQDRIAVNATTQAMKVSDFLDFTTWTQLNQFQIEKGGDDFLIGLFAYRNDLVVIGSRKRFFLAFFDPATASGGYSGGLNANTSFLRDLTREAGPVGRRAMKEAAGRIWFITDNAIYAFVPQLDQELTVLGEPISAPIQPIMNRMSANYAAGACIEHYGYRLYFAMPISDEPVNVSLITVESQSTVGIDLPFDLPALLATGSIAIVTTSSSHNLRPNALVQISGAVDPLLNGVFTVLTTPDDTSFTITTDAIAGASVGDRVTAQQIATRNNVVAVYNLNLDAWESIDFPPSGLSIDYLRVVDYGARRRLWAVDQDLGPALYEEGSVDVIGQITGGVDVPFDLPVELSSSNFASAPIPSTVKSRRYRFPYARQVRCAEATLQLAAGDSGTVTLNVRTPQSNVWTKDRSFSSSASGDRGGRIRCGKRALEAELEVTTATGRPLVRTLSVETAAVGRAQEE